MTHQPKTKPTRRSHANRPELESDQNTVTIPTQTTVEDVTKAAQLRSTFSPNRHPVTIQLSFNIQIKSPGFPHYTKAHPPTLLPVVQTQPYPMLVGVLELLAPSGRPDSYSRQHCVTAASGTPFATHRDSTEVWPIPKGGQFVTFFENDLVYRLPGYSPESDNSAQSGLRVHEFPIYSKFFPISELNVTDNLDQIRAQIDSIRSLTPTAPELD